MPGTELLLRRTAAGGGAIAPGLAGAGVVAGVGTLTFEDALRFGRSPTGTRVPVAIELKSDGSGGVAWDVLAVAQSLSGLGNAELDVVVDPALTEAELAAASLVVVSAPSDLTGQSFGAVVFSGAWTADVIYGPGAVTLSGFHFSSGLGVGCTTAGDCASGFCTDGVCCGSACEGGPDDCQSCNGAGICVVGSGACDDGNACTGGDACSGGSCAGTVAPDGSACDDGNACTTSTSCAGGACQGGLSADEGVPA